MLCFNVRRGKITKEMGKSMIFHSHILKFGIVCIILNMWRLENENRCYQNSEDAFGNFSCDF